MPANKVSPAAQLVLIGAAHIDETVRLLDALQPGESNRVQRTVSVGGVAANATFAAQKLVPTHLITTVSDDQSGRSVADFLTNAGISYEFIYSNRNPTGQYTAVLDNQGELVIGLASTEIVESLTGQNLDRLLGHTPPPALLAFDTNLSSTCIADICNSGLSGSLAAIGVSPVKTTRLTGFGSHIKYLFVNRNEAAMLAGCMPTLPLRDISSALLELQFQQQVITDGAAAVFMRDSDQEELFPVLDTTGAAQTPRLRQRSVNGAGDALAGATLAGLAKGLDLRSSLTDLGLPAAAAVIAG